MDTSNLTDYKSREFAELLDVSVKVLVQDIISILQVFSCRLYELRKYKKQLEGNEKLAQELQDRNKSLSGTTD
ncbi:MAG: hypothetical protein ACLUDG_04620 [Butyricicoccus sp.]